MDHKRELEILNIRLKVNQNALKRKNDLEEINENKETIRKLKERIAVIKIKGF